jgi:hypothetical protein
MFKVIEIVARNQAEFAFPTQTLHIKHEPEVQAPYRAG